MSFGSLRSRKSRRAAAVLGGAGIALAALWSVGADAAHAQRGGRPSNPSSSGRGGGGDSRPSRPSSFEPRRTETPRFEPRRNDAPGSPWRPSAPSGLGRGGGPETPRYEPSPGYVEMLERMRARERERATGGGGSRDAGTPRLSLPRDFSSSDIGRDRPENPSARRPRPARPDDLDGDRRGEGSRPLPWYGYQPPVIWGPPAYSGVYGGYYSPFFSYDRYNRYWWDPTLGFYPSPYLFPGDAFGWGYGTVGSISGGAAQAQQPRNPPPGIDLGTATVMTAPGAGTPAPSNLLLFSEYRSEFAAKETLPAPFADYGVTPPYVAADAVLTAPWAYEGGRDAAGLNPWEDSDPYVKADEARAIRLRTALNSLSGLWQNEDVRALRRYVGESEPVAVFAGDRYLYSLTRDDLTPLVVDLLEGIDSVTFRLTDFKRRTDGLVSVYATHQFRVRGSDEVRERPVRMTLVYRDGEWKLTGLSVGTP